MKPGATPTIDPRRRRAFSLIESLVGASVLAIATVGIVGPLVAAQQQAQVADELTSASLLARQLMDEIASRPFVDPDQPSLPGPESGETDRSLYDNVDDYAGYADRTDTLTALDGASIAASDAARIYRRQVQAEYRATPDGPATATGDFLVVTVTVTAPHGEVVTVRRLFCNYTRT